jgi:transglutaminase-like putative cysteine protease
MRSFLIYSVSILTVLSLQTGLFSQEEKPVPESAKQQDFSVHYRVTKRFIFTALTNLATLQFRYPLTRKDVLYQEFMDFSSDPQQNAIIPDLDKNQIAVYYFSNIPSGQARKITMSYIVKLSVPPQKVDPAKVSSDYTAAGEDISKFLQSQGDIDLENPFIREKMQKIVGEEANPYYKGKAIYDYIVRNIRYEKIEGEYGVQMPFETLINARGVCADITKLFISLARACGIPARQVDGIVFQPNVSEKKSRGKEGHAWVEIYLIPYGWLSVDPTFGISNKDNFYCFRNQTHIAEFYGQLHSRRMGTLYRGSYFEVRTQDRILGNALRDDGGIEIDLLTKIEGKE